MLTSTMAALKYNTVCMSNFFVRKFRLGNREVTPAFTEENGQTRAVCTGEPRPKQDTGCKDIDGKKAH